MAGALVGGAFLSATLQVLFDRMASRQVLDFFKGQKLDARLLKKLKTKMITVNKVLDDTDDRQHTDPNVKQWLDELKDAVYEAEDLLDEIASEVQRSKMESESEITLKKVQDFAYSHGPFKTGKKEKLEEILETLDYLIDQKDALGLIDGIGQKSSYQRTPTTSIPDESVTYGRDVDKEAIMRWVLSEDGNSGNPDVLAIVGMGGLGKTTLAQLVYSDSKGFDQKAWVYVSEEFIVSKITKEILEGFTRQSSNTDNLDQLQNRLKEHLTGKKFLLVLDDVWNKQYTEWNHLLKPLRFGREGSKILVTTRNEDVAQSIQTSPTYRLEKLSDNDCWLLFEKHAFIGRDSSNAHLNLERIGRQIIEKCDGLPLAAKVLGGVLKSKRDLREWTKILESDMWNLQNDGVLPVLKLSYRFLPSHLKQCFAYCALFPKDYEFKKEQLIRLWMAEGLLSQPNMNMTIEDVEEAGENCFLDLVSRSFLQQSIKRECFLMHDLINDLAKSISGEFYLRLGVDKSWEIPERIRHLWLDYNKENEVIKHIFGIQKLRTFLYLGSGHDKEVQNSLSTFTRLRVLSLFWYKMIELPDSIGDLIHLRYFDLSQSSIERLPDSISNLCNLETLILYGCQNLVELPATVFKLLNLCHLDIRGTELRKMPPQMGKLKKLGELAYFIVGKQSDCNSIKELGELKRLRGYLRIEKLRNVLQVEECVEANMKCKEKLKMLELIWNDEGSEDSLHERNVLEQLQPHTNIEQVSISGYAGTRFAYWVGDSSFSNMVKLELEKCRYCSFLPPLGQLASLKRLSIVEFDGLTVVGPEFYGNSNEAPFGCLEYLRFESMSKWEEWAPYSNMDENDYDADGATAAFPLLQVLEIKKCPTLKKTLPTHLPSLTKLVIWQCDQLASIPRAPAIQHLWIKDNSRDMKLHESYSSSALRSVQVNCWHSADSPLEIVKQLMSLNSITLKHLIVRDCDSLTSFPLDLFPMLEQLMIFDCPKLESLSAASQASLQHWTFLGLWRCPNLKWHPECMASLFASLPQLCIYNCPSIVVDLLRLCPNLQHLGLGGGEEGSCYESQGLNAVDLVRQFPHLSHLIFGRDEEGSWHEETHKKKGNWYEEVEYFPPENVLLASSLTSIEISDFKKLKSFDKTGLQSLTSLRELKIGHCPNLESLGCMSLQYLTSLRVLEISYCSRLQSLRELPPTLTSLRVERLENLEPFGNESLRSLTSLRALKIEYCPKFQSLPEVWLPSTLTSLSISGLENLETLDHWGLHRLTSLTELIICYCPNLQSIQKEGLPSSLQHADIASCPLLQLGGDWPFNHSRRL